jgi:hypothetical protein
MRRCLGHKARNDANHSSFFLETPRNADIAASAGNGKRRLVHHSLSIAGTRTRPARIRIRLDGCGRETWPRVPVGPITAIKAAKPRVIN